ncbi:MAG: hypothetical protein ACRELB_22720, partial [Polyangiaceae bacterium]
VGTLCLAALAKSRWPPGASPRAEATLAAERAWPSSLHFALEGYFEVLQQEPCTCHIEATMTLRDASASPGLDILQGVVQGVDADGGVRIDASGTATIRSSALSCETNTWVNMVRVDSNRRIPPYVHTLVEKVLLPVHRSHPIERVSLVRAG